MEKMKLIENINFEKFYPNVINEKRAMKKQEKDGKFKLWAVGAFVVMFGIINVIAYAILTLTGGIVLF